MSTVYLHEFLTTSSVDVTSLVPDVGTYVMGGIDLMFTTTSGSGYCWPPYGNGGHLHTAYSEPGVVGDLGTSIRYKWKTSLGGSTLVAGVRCSMTFANTSYGLEMNHANGELSLRRELSGVNTVLATTVLSVALDTWCDLELVRRNTNTGSQTIEGWWNGSRVLAPVSDTSLGNGLSTYYSYNDAGSSTSTTGIHIDTFRVRDDLPTVSSLRTIIRGIARGKAR